MSENAFAGLRAEIRREMGRLSKLIEELQELRNDVESPPSRAEVRAFGSILHDFYTGIEKIFRRIAVELNGNIPKGEDWHLQLLNRMSVPLDSIRPAVISENIYDELNELLRFRHVFRYSYGFELQWNRLEPLVERADELHRQFEQEIQEFQTFLKEIESA